MLYDLKRLLLALLLVSPGAGIAGDVTELSPSEANSMNLNFIAWPGLSAAEIEEQRRKLHCTPVEFALPLYISEKYPDWTQVLVKGEVYLSGKLLTGTETFSVQIENKNIALSCFPFDSEYTVNVTLSYMPSDLARMPMCPVAFSFKDFERFVRFENGE